MTNTLLARVLETANIDPTVRPQDDFYRHVNGTWLATHTIPADRPMDGAFHALRDASEKYARDIAQDAASGALKDPDAGILQGPSSSTRRQSTPPERFPCEPSSPPSTRARVARSWPRPWGP